jgi:dihydropyrimidinase
MGEAFDLLVCGGLLVGRQRIYRSDLAILEGRIAEIRYGIARGEARRVIEAEGKFVLPGIIDVHTHPLYEDDFETTSLTAAYGGTTTLIHYVYAFPGQKVSESIENGIREASRVSYLDFGLHVGLFEVEKQYRQIPEAFRYGVRTFKMFMTYAKLGRMTSDYYLAAAMDLIAEHGGMAMVHAENGLATDYLEDKFNSEGIPAIKAFCRMRPAALEAEAIHRAIAIAEVCGCPLYIPHISAGRGLEPVRRARSTGMPVYAETCPQYLLLTEEDLFRWGPLAKIGPPLRTPEDNEALWKGIEDGTIDVVASDHAPKAKRETDDFFEAGYGSPQAETLLTLMYDAGVNGGRITLLRLVQLLSETPARIFGLYPRKGCLEVGSDADIVILDPQVQHMLSGKTQHSRAGYTLYEGRQCLGRPWMTLQRGRVVLDGGQLVAKPGDGLFIPLA